MTHPPTDDPGATPMPDDPPPSDDARHPRDIEHAADSQLPDDPHPAGDTGRAAESSIPAHLSPAGDAPVAGEPPLFDDGALGRLLRAEIPSAGPGYWDRIDAALADASAAADVDPADGDPNEGEPGADRSAAIAGPADNPDTAPTVVRLTTMTENSSPTPATSHRRLRILAIAAGILTFLVGGNALYAALNDTSSDVVATTDGTATDDGGADPDTTAADDGDTNDSNADTADDGTTADDDTAIDGVVFLDDLDAELLAHLADNGLIVDGVRLPEAFEYVREGTVESTSWVEFRDPAQRSISIGWRPGDASTIETEAAEMGFDLDRRTLADGRSVSVSVEGDGDSAPVRVAFAADGRLVEVVGRGVDTDVLLQIMTDLVVVSPTNTGDDGSPEPTSTTVPGSPAGTFCYQAADDDGDVVRPSVDVRIRDRVPNIEEYSSAESPIEGELRIDVGDDPAGDIYRRFVGVAIGDSFELDITTWSGAEVSSTTETWDNVGIAGQDTGGGAATIRPGETTIGTADGTVLVPVDCATVDRAFADIGVFEAAALTIDTIVRTDEELRFRRGENDTTVRGNAVLGERARYRLDATAGQTMTVSITSVEDNADFGVIAPSGLLLAIEAEEPTTLRLPHTGTYEIVVAPTRGNTTFDLTITIE